MIIIPYKKVVFKTNLPFADIYRNLANEVCSGIDFSGKIGNQYQKLPKFIGSIGEDRFEFSWNKDFSIPCAPKFKGYWTPHISGKITDKGNYRIVNIEVMPTLYTLIFLTFWTSLCVLMVLFTLLAFSDVQQNRFFLLLSIPLLLVGYGGFIKLFSKECHYIILVFKDLLGISEGNKSLSGKNG